MLLQDLEEGSALRVFGQEIRDFIKELDATIDDQPLDQPKYHVVRRGSSHFLTFKFVGKKARKFPQHSLVLYLPWSDSICSIPQIQDDPDGWHGGRCAVLWARPGQGEIARQFIRLAYENERQVH